MIKASGRELSFLLLLGTFGCFSMTFAVVAKPTAQSCAIVRFGIGFCYTLCYAALATKINRIHRIFNDPGRSPRETTLHKPAIAADDRVDAHVGWDRVRRGLVDQATAYRDALPPYQGGEYQGLSRFRGWLLRDRSAVSVPVDRWVDALVALISWEFVGTMTCYPLTKCWRVALFLNGPTIITNAGPTSLNIKAQPEGFLSKRRLTNVQNASWRISTDVVKTSSSGLL